MLILQRFYVGYFAVIVIDSIVCCRVFHQFYLFARKALLPLCSREYFLLENISKIFVLISGPIVVSNLKF